MTVGTWSDPNHQQQIGNQLKIAYDNAHAVARRFARAFAPHEADPPAMTVVLDPGQLWDGTSLTEVAQQATAALTAPATNPRIDRVVIDANSGALQVVAGTENAAPSPPAIPSGKLPVAQVALTVGMTEITNQALTDERVAGGAGGGGIVPSSTELTIAAGAITLTGNAHRVDTEPDGPNPDGVAADDLTDIDVSALAEGDLALLSAENAARVATARGTGNIVLTRGDYAFDDLDKVLAIRRRGASAVEVFRSHPPPAALSEFYESAEQTIVAGGSVVLSHQLSAAPRLLQLLLVCKTANAGYSVGDEVFINPHFQWDNTSTRGVSVIDGTTQLKLQYSSNTNPFTVIHATTGNTVNALNANWRLIVRAWR